MSKVKEFYLEQKTNSTNPLLEFKARLETAGSRFKKELELFSPSDPHLYANLNEISSKLPHLPKWFFVMCGEKFQKENVEKVLKILHN